MDGVRLGVRTDLEKFVEIRRIRRQNRASAPFPCVIQFESDDVLDLPSDLLGNTVDFLRTISRFTADRMPGVRAFGIPGLCLKSAHPVLLMRGAESAGRRKMEQSESMRFRLCKVRQFYCLSHFARFASVNMGGAIETEALPCAESSSLPNGWGAGSRTESRV